MSVHLFLYLLLPSAWSAVSTIPTGPEGAAHLRKLLGAGSCPECCIDMIFLLDQSASVGVDNWTNLMDSLDKLIVALSQSSGAASTRIGLGRFGNPGPRAGSVPRETSEFKWANKFDRFNKPGIGWGENQWWVDPYTYNTEVRGRYKKGPLSNSGVVRHLRDVLRSWRGHYNKGRTALRDGLLIAMEQFTKGIYYKWDDLMPNCKPEKRKKYIIIITDGGPNPGAFEIDPVEGNLGRYIMKDGQRIPANRNGGSNPHQDPCILRTDLSPPETKTVAQRLYDMPGVDALVWGVGPRFLEHRKWCGCLYNKTPEDMAKDNTAEGRIVSKDTYSDTAAMVQQFNPCTLCSCNPVDLVILIDESSSMCPKGKSRCGISERPAFSSQLQMWKNLIDKMNPWNNVRVALFSFGNRVRRWVRLKKSGARSICSRGCEVNPWSQAKVKSYLDNLENAFEGGQTVIAMAIYEAMEELRYAPPREDGKSPRKLLILSTDGGPNTNYYTVDQNANRIRWEDRNTPGIENSDKCYSKAPGSGWCVFQTHGWQGRQETQTNKASCNQAVCTDSGDAVFYYPGTQNSYPEELKLTGITAIVVLTGWRAPQHRPDLACLTDANNFVTADSFQEAANSSGLALALGASVCTFTSVKPSIPVYEHLHAVYGAWLQLQTPQTIRANQIGIIFGAGAIVGLLVTTLFTRKQSPEYQELLDTDVV